MDYLQEEKPSKMNQNEVKHSKIDVKNGLIPAKPEADFLLWCQAERFYRVAVYVTPSPWPKKLPAIGVPRMPKSSPGQKTSL